MIVATEAGHWYSKTGAPAYEMPAKNGNPRPTTLRDARKLNLVPSVTMIMRCAAAPALEKWKRDQLLMASLTLPRVDGEETDEFAKRVIKDAEDQSKMARELGTTIHGCIEKDLCRQPYDQNYNPHVDGALVVISKWCDGLDDIRPEKSFCHPLGYGGKCDAHKEGFVADFKSKDFTTDKLPETYDDHAMQLAAYREGFKMPYARGAIVYVSTSVPGLAHLVEVQEDDLARGWNMFLTLLRFWQFKNRYVPQIGMENIA